jgi:hypothetical protein
MFCNGSATVDRPEARLPTSPIPGECEETTPGPDCPPATNGRSQELDDIIIVRVVSDLLQPSEEADGIDLVSFVTMAGRSALIGGLFERESTKLDPDLGANSAELFLRGP